MKKDEDFSTEILYEDSFEDRPLDDAAGSVDSPKGILNKFLSMKRWKKVVLCVVTALVVVVAGLAGSFFYLRAQGEKNLKTKVTADAKDESNPEEGLFITYNDKKYKYNEDVINFLCLGIDKEIPIEEKLETGSEGLADAVALISINVESGQIKVFAVPRDTIVPIKVLSAEGNFVKRENQQITLQYAYGSDATKSCELMADAVSNLFFKIPIQRYCSINLNAISILNDAIGGVDVQVLEDVEIKGKIRYAGESVHLDGEMAEDYIRERDTNVFGSSMGRLERQKQYMSSYFATAKEVVKSDMTLPVTIFQSLEGNMCTNITVEDIAYLVPELLSVSLNMEDMSMVPGEVTQPDEHEAYIVNTEQLKEMVIEYFYEEIS